MDIREICAEKIRAMSDRARYRDFFDVYLIQTTYKLELQEILDYVNQKEIRKPITKASILRNWNMIGEQKEIEKQAIFYSQPIDDSLIEEMLKGFPSFEIGLSDWQDSYIYLSTILNNSQWIELWDVHAIDSN